MRGKNIFLEDIQKEISKSELYNLDDEFSKTKKNRSPLVWITISIFILVFVSIAFFVNAYIEKKTRNIAVNIQAFEDVNLREVLDKSKQYDRELIEAQRTLKDLQSLRDVEIDQLRSANVRKIDILNTRNMNKAERDHEIAKLESQLKKDTLALSKKYQPNITAAGQEVSMIEEKIASYDSRMVTLAKEQEVILDNQQQIFNIRQKEMADYYESQIEQLRKRIDSEQTAFNEYKENLGNAMGKNKQEEIEQLMLTYNPHFTEEAIVTVLKEGIQQSEDPIKFGFQAVLSQEHIYSEKQLTEQYKKIQNIQLLLKRLRAIPYINSVPPTLEYVENALYELVKEYENLWHDLVSLVVTKSASVSSRDIVIDQFVYALNSLVSSSRENGYVLDSRNPKELVVFIGDLYALEDGETGFIFRKDDEIIATVQFYKRGEKFYARVVEMANSENAIQPFDKILVEKK